MSSIAFLLPAARRSALAAAGLLLALLGLAVAPAARADDFLPPEQAFRISVKPADARSVEVDFAIAPGYYMYRGRFKFGAQGATLGAPQFPPGKVKFDDALGETVETYHDAVRIRVPVTQAGASFRLGVIGQGCAEGGLCYPPMPSVADVKLAGFGGDGSARVLASGDAAASQMPPVTVTVAATSAAAAGSGAEAAPGGGGPEAAANGSTTGAKPAIAGAFTRAAPLSRPAGEAASAASAAPTAPDAASSSQGAAGKVSAPPQGEPQATPASRPPEGADEAGALAGVLRGHHFWSVIVAFLGAGLLLSLTPCVLPMLPILSSIIVGHMAGRGAGPTTAAERRRGLMLAASYSLGMALVYTAFGVAAGLAGRGLSAALQTPAVLGAFGVLLVLLSLSMFGLYELQLPSALTTRLTQASHRLRGGHVAGVFAMGGLSALIVSPCVAAPLAGALLYLSQTHDVLLGGTALFALACGMSVPLLLVGASAGTLLPKAGAWMDGVKQFFGVLLLAVAVWMVQPVLPPALVLGAWGALLALAAALLLPPASAAQAHGHAGFGTALRRGAGWLALLLALAEVAGAASGAVDPWQPLAPLAGARGAALSAGAASPAAADLPFQPVHSVQELDTALQTAGRPAMLDFYADWCVSCKEMDRFTFSDPAIRQRLAHALLLRADVTDDTPANRALLKRFSLFGPPGTIFFDAQGHEVAGVRVAGFQNVDRFGKTLAAAGL
jgi:thiol:disulfide interchange protein DsbD